MDLENLKNTWKEEEIQDIPEISTEKQKELHNPLEKIRKNMRIEFWNSLAAIIFIVIFAFISIKDVKLKTYTLTLVLAMIGITGFYFSKFFSLYKEINNNTINTKDALKDLIHQFDLNKQYYISYYVSYVPFFICEVILINYLIEPIKHNIPDYISMLVFLLVIVFVLSFTFAFGVFWFRGYYGKHIENVKRILHNLDEK